MADELNGAAPAAAESVPASEPASTPPPSLPDAAPGAGTPPKSFEDTLRETAFKVHAKHNPPRDNGRFAPHIPTARPIEAAPETVSDQAPQAAPEPAPKPAIEAPNAWSAADRAVWANVPPEAQAIISRRETEAHRRISQMGEQVRASEPLRAVLDQNRDMLQRTGHTPEAALQQYFDVSRQLDRNPAAVIKALAQMYRVPLQALAQSAAQQPAAAPSDPRLWAEVRRMRSELDGYRQAEQTERERSVTSAIDRFAEKNPYFNELQTEIHGHVIALREENPDWTPEQVLEKAYDAALWGNPTHRERILLDQRKAAEDKAKAEQEKLVKEAKRHQALNIRGAVNGVQPKGSWEDTLRAEVEKRVPRRA